MRGVPQRVRQVPLTMHHVSDERVPESSRVYLMQARVLESGGLVLLVLPQPQTGTRRPTTATTNPREQTTTQPGLLGPGKREKYTKHEREGKGRVNYLPNKNIYFRISIFCDVFSFSSSFFLHLSFLPAEGKILRNFVPEILSPNLPK
jgi:hypothetical protein